MAFRVYIITFVFLCIYPSSTVTGYNPKDVKAWCSETPYPKPCEFLTRDSKSTDKPIRSKFEFLKIVTKLALDQAILAKSHAFKLGTKYCATREKAAWKDCLKLYDFTVSRLNETMDPTVKCSRIDVQTWLSAALTNLDTCRAGFLELGVTSFILPLISNVSHLISNALAINRVSFDYTQPQKDGFPSWVKPRDRKLLQSSMPRDNAVVAKDGSGNYRTIKEAIDAASGSGRFVIYVKEGIYYEYLQITKTNVMLRGDGKGKTVITGSRSFVGGMTTFTSATVAAEGDIFLARGITFRNTAGARNGQAVALKSMSDRSVFYKCSFEGYQDTLYVHTNRQFYRDCDVYGTVDFIFGNAAAIFQNCNIFARRSPTRTNTITAQGKSDPNTTTGIIIHNSRVTAAPDLQPVLRSTKTYLGRPWGQYSTTVFMKTFLDSLIDPHGWLEWNGTFALSTLFYAEFRNTGLGASTSGRVTWPGFRVIHSATEASSFTVDTFIAGNSWIPSDVPFTGGL